MKRTGSKDFSIASILADKLESRSSSLVRNVRYTDSGLGEESSLTCYLKCYHSDSAVHLNGEAKSRQCKCDLRQETVYNRCATVCSAEGRRESSVGSVSLEADVTSVNYLGRKPEEISLNYLPRDSKMHIIANFGLKEESLPGVNIAKNSSIYSMREESNCVSGKVATGEQREGEMHARNEEDTKVARENVSCNTRKSSSNIEMIGESLAEISSKASLDEAGKNCVLDREDHPTMSKPRSTVGFRPIESSKRVAGKASPSSSSSSFGTAMSRHEKTSEGSAHPKNVLSPRKEKLDWLEYTRYRPPKIPRRVLIGREKRRTPSMHPRIPFSSPQLQFLEEKFRNNVYLTKNELTEIASILRLPHSRVKIWFQNRRARARREEQCLHEPR